MVVKIFGVEIALPKCSVEFLCGKRTVGIHSDCVRHAPCKLGATSFNMNASKAVAVRK